MILPDFDICYRAIQARDPRFDGQFFVGVQTTGVYCRPVCRARTPLAKSCRFFLAAAAAEGAGFRPCLLCRPELAPADSSSLDRALYSHVQAASLRGDSLAQIAAGAGYSERQLRRILVQRCGVNPVQIAQTQRLLFAKKLLQETRLPVTDVAFSAGFKSLRRLNALFASRYRLSPSGLRRQTLNGQPLAETMCLRLAYRPPFNWKAMLVYLAKRGTRGVEAVDFKRGEYARSVAGSGEGAAGWVRIKQPPTGDYLEIIAPAHLSTGLPDLLARLRNVFDLDANPAIIDAHLATDPRLKSLVKKNAGLRAPGAFDAFELALRAVLGQQVSVTGASTISARIAEKFGRAVETPLPSINRLSPTADSLANAAEGDIASLGMPGARARTIIALAQSAVRGELSFPHHITLEDAVAALRKIPGIGDWTAHYIAMRALRFPDAFPEADLGLRKALTPGARAPYAASSRVRQLAEAWRPWRSYAAMHLWHSLQPAQP